MKKLAVVVMMIAIAMFMAAGMASADDHNGRGNPHWGGIHGTYAMTATGNCLWAPGGFNLPPAYPPFISPLAYSSHFMAQGTWFFGPNGKGRAEYTQYGISAPPVVGAPSGNLYFAGAASVKWTFDFTYTVQDGMITGEIVPPAPGEYHAEFLSGPKTGVKYTVDKFTFFGVVSRDHKTLTLNSGSDREHPENPEVQLFSFSDSTTCFAICNSGRVLIRVSDQDDD